MNLRTSEANCRRSVMLNIPTHAPVLSYRGPSNSTGPGIFLHKNRPPERIIITSLGRLVSFVMFSLRSLKSFPYIPTSSSAILRATVRSMACLSVCQLGNFFSRPSLSLKELAQNVKREQQKRHILIICCCRLCFLEATHNSLPPARLRGARQNETAKSQIRPGPAAE